MKILSSRSRSSGLMTATFACAEAQLQAQAGNGAHANTHANSERYAHMSGRTQLHKARPKAAKVGFGKAPTARDSSVQSHCGWLLSTRLVAGGGWCEAVRIFQHVSTNQPTITNRSTNQHQQTLRKSSLSDQFCFFIASMRACMVAPSLRNALGSNLLYFQGVD